MIVITDAGDATFKVIEWDVTGQRNPSKARVVVEEQLFVVIKQVLTSNSPVLKERFESHQSSNTVNRARRTTEDRIRSMEIWLRLFHDRITPDTYKVAIDEMWFLTAASENYEFDITRLESWFGQWYTLQDLSQLNTRELLFPCWRFDHAQGFLDATCEVVYGVPGHVDEKNPAEPSLPRFHLPWLVIGNLNAAKGRLRQILHAALWKPAKQLLDAKCSCKVKTLFGYIEALHRTGAWPFDPVWSRECVEGIFSRLDRFSYQPSLNACMDCRQNYEDIVKGAVVTTRYHFDGLCLDCMKRSEPKPESSDKDYFEANTPTVDDWSRPCRVRHGEPTWYHSFMGKREHRDVLLKHLRGTYPSRTR